MTSTTRALPLPSLPTQRPWSGGSRLKTLPAAVEPKRYWVWLRPSKPASSPGLLLVTDLGWALAPTGEELPGALWLRSFATAPSPPPPPVSGFCTAAVSLVTSDTAAVQNPETGGGGGDGAVANDRSHSAPGSSSPVGASAQPKSVTNSSPGLLAGFDGLNHTQYRFGSTAAGNVFSLEPPDQGLCVGSDGSGNARVVEVINDVMRVYTTSGAALTDPQDLNLFLGYSLQFNRTTGDLGAFVTDPSCLF